MPFITMKPGVICINEAQCAATAVLMKTVMMVDQVLTSLNIVSTGWSDVCAF